MQAIIGTSEWSFNIAKHVYFFFVVFLVITDAMK